MRFAHPRLHLTCVALFALFAALSLWKPSAAAVVAVRCSASSPTVVNFNYNNGRSFIVNVPVSPYPSVESGAAGTKAGDFILRNGAAANGNTYQCAGCDQPLKGCDDLGAFFGGTMEKLGPGRYRIKPDANGTFQLNIACSECFDECSSADAGDYSDLSCREEENAPAGSELLHYLNLE